MKRMIFLSIFALVSITIFADDGSWNVLYDETRGSLYSETENKEITLEKEILKFGGLLSATTEAIFQFRNVTDKNLEIDAGFPIKLSINISEGTIYDDNYQPIEDAYFLSESKYGSNEYHVSIAKKIFGDNLKYYKNTFEDGFTGQSPYYFTDNDIEYRKTVQSKDFDNEYYFTVKQNGKKIDFDFVVIETAVKNSELIVIYNYHHKLFFKPKETSIVECSYSEDCLKGNVNMGYGMGYSYQWDYILGTGGTWKGAIKELYFILPDSEALVDLPKPFKYIETFKNNKIYLAANYKPEKEDLITVQETITDGPAVYLLNQTWFEEPEYTELPSSPADSNVKVISASSFINEKVTLYTDNGVIKNADYSPLRLFDGVRETAWCEAAKDDGVGEWVEFEILQDVIGVEIQNGFNKSFTEIEGKDITTYYEKNNRVKTLEFVSKDNKISKEISVDDIKEDFQYIDLTLPKGIYKVFIRDIYKGTKWKDTCIGEIKFHFKSDFIDQKSKNDDFFRKYF